MSAAEPPQGANSAPAGGSAAAKPRAWGDHTSRYDPSAPRAVFGLLAVAMAATTMALFVVLPAQVEAVDGQRDAVTAGEPLPQSDLRVASNAACTDTRCTCAALEAYPLRDRRGSATRVAGPAR
jgi:hypothetical protein